jgi:L-cysteine:1D-myo-inositol 2-amino-2-deoxy-alpha-D-glucopyranoside ligase
MVGLDGEKMSKSRGNLVFVSGLRADGVDPGALRLALLAAHYRSDREWTPAALADGRRRIQAWRAAVGRAAAAPVTDLRPRLRAALADDLDTPAALAAVDRWCEAPGSDPAAPAQARDAVDALLGVAL